MKNLKKLGLSLIAILMVISLAGCGSKEVSGSLEDLMVKVYEDIPEDERPMMLMNTEITDENIESFLGTSDIEYEEALASEPGIGSIAHSVVLLRVKKGADIDAIKTKIEESVDPRKWICVEAEEVKVESKGNLIILIMASKDQASTISKSFNNL